MKFRNCPDGANVGDSGMKRTDKMMLISWAAGSARNVCVTSTWTVAWFDLTKPLQVSYG